MRGIHTSGAWPHPDAQVAMECSDGTYAARGTVMRASEVRPNWWWIRPTTDWDNYTTRSDVHLPVGALRPAPGSPEDDLANGYPPTYNLHASDPEAAGRRIVEAMNAFAQQFKPTLPHPETDTMRLTHYVPLDTVLGRPIRQHLTCCGLLVADLIDAFDGNDGVSDRYIPGGTPRPGQITCGTCAVHVPRWWDPEWDKPAVDPIDAGVLTFRVKADQIVRASEIIAELVGRLDPESIRGGILIIPTSKEQ